MYFAWHVHIFVHMMSTIVFTTSSHPQSLESSYILFTALLALFYVTILYLGGIFVGDKQYHCLSAPPKHIRPHLKCPRDTSPLLFSHFVPHQTSNLNVLLSMFWQLHTGSILRTAFQTSAPNLLRCASRSSSCIYPGRPLSTPASDPCDGPI